MLLFHSLTSPYSRKARVLLIEKQIPYEGINVADSDRQPNEHNPLGKVPTLVLDDGTVLFDSTVITETIDALYPTLRLIPDAPLERAMVRRWESLADGLCDIVIPVVLERRRPEAQQNQAYVEKLLGKARAVLDTIESWQKGHDYAHGDAFTLADIAVVSAIGYLNLRIPELLGGLPEIQRYTAQQLERPSLRDTIPPNLPVRG